MICKLHKKVFATRPVARAFASVMKPFEKLLGAMLVHITREDEEGLEKILLDESRLFVEQLDEINKLWASEEGGHRKWWFKEDVVEFVSWDITAMYPNLKHNFVIREIDEAIVRIIKKKSGKGKEEMEELREVVMPMLIFALQHQFLYVLSEGSGDKEEKIFYYQHQGIYIGSSASGAIANLALLGREREMISELEKEDGWVLVYRRYIDDICAILVGRASLLSDGGVEESRAEVVALRKKMEDKINQLDREEGSVQVDPASVIQAVKQKGAQSESVRLEYLDLDVELGWNEKGWLQLNTGIYRKPAAADNYLHFTSAHPESLKRGMVRGELCRYLTRCSTSERFETAWERFRTALMTRGYPAHWLDKVRRGIEWEGRGEMNASMNKKRALKRKGGSGGKGKGEAVVVVVPAKPGVREWWKKCQGVEGLVDLGLLEEEVRKRVPKEMMLCESATQNQGGQIKATGKATRKKAKT